MTRIYRVPVYLLLWTCALGAAGFPWHELQLAPEHVAFFFNSNRHLAEECRRSSSCPFKMHLDRTACWGYEEGCTSDYAYSQPSCPGDSKGWVQTKHEQIHTFKQQGDFGYVKEQREQLKVYCRPEEEGDSSLECTDHLQFCRGKNIYIDFRPLKHRKEIVHYHMDVLDTGQIGGHCRLDKKLLAKNAVQISPLQSWGPEIRHFTEQEEQVEPRGKMCDRWVDTPTFIMKLDATVNMYHHFCDFFNLYASQHLNSSDEFAFSRNTQILIWETLPYRSNFGVAFDAFTKNPVWILDNVSGDRVCFKDVVFPLLPRMIFGLYYNTPIIWGCEKSGLFHAFSHHLLHRLGVKKRSVGDQKIHVTLLSRDTEFRRILNEEQLVEALRGDRTFILRKVKYSHRMDFRQQLRQDQWTDIFIGMHGAGLTHLLFLPDWAVIFELYNCFDPNCYKDLARLRGIKYITWENSTLLKPQDEGTHPDGGPHEKFTNYEFDVKEFMRLVRKGAEHVKNHRGWQNIQEHLRNTQKHEEL
ncbi:EGF domain-specific O-linked N-acetylglucosamine transferase [Procambarus clarkii]|uniref:EGF domain-specific O-linked N-acetylglucosamine transferase n=1 Tax=Procambarus clarkii TaxID=6728 RepID=UPI001E67446F|nr:EGF domain-specific O-linked N-acetylglucosamine transferase-like [Procambarus clarkii]XP_045618393.1 EGF domain-specific O-linked N-acetylglucosamine transferase-like [Procambarus clarkii]XP_045618394.1 EGF domain-specific O-linked N-acetylglucosamine transferase-like [Procambarus clarkii]XP_045618395.1 EGF domain-specific O-linked N-acetylglucosamine transferase-like [Procambarus clarkii]